MLFSTLFNRLANLQQRRRTTIQLSALSDRQLQELGISRQDILEASRRR
ncbi:DUF1127 domain-containing protein [Devosia albogilva]|uniref:DUF1127 domain-containing protein n=1 Tax=Devosia albogilva TaxID=429726 RepID=A0ABW5QM32_9HYPH